MIEEQRRVRAPELEPLVLSASSKRSRRAKRSRIAFEELYDGRIALAGEVPCLSQSYHDLFNALIFAAFPRSKRALHARQWRALSSWIDPTTNRIPGQRTREQDALTIFDEGGVVLAMTPRAERAWRGSRTTTSVEAVRGEVAPILFGHALLEHLFDGHVEVRASAIVCVVPEDVLSSTPSLLDAVDRQLSARLASPEEFREPRAESIFTLERDGRVSFGPPK